MVVRPRHPSDTDRLLAIARRVHVTDGYPPYFPRLDFEVLLFGHETLGAWVCQAGEQVVGQVALHPRTGERAMALASSALDVHSDALGVVARLIVDPEWRGKGVGRVLLEQAASEARARGLHPMLDVATHLRRAVSLYENCGWGRAGEVTTRFADGTTLDEFVYVAPPAVQPGPGPGCVSG